jgi:hypothetical protein
MSNETKKSLLFDEEKFLEQCNDRRDLSKEEFEEKYRKFPEKVEFDFIVWYSGIDKKKVLNAYQRWKLENNIE